MANNFNILDREYTEHDSFAQSNLGDDFILTFPGEIIHLDFVRLVFDTDGVVGDRSVGMTLRDPGGTGIWSVPSLFPQTANTLVIYTYFPGVAREATPTNGIIVCAMPPQFVVPNGYSLRFFDTAGVSGGDNIFLRLGYRRIGVRNI